MSSICTRPTNPAEPCLSSSSPALFPPSVHAAVQAVCKFITDRQPSNTARDLAPFGPQQRKLLAAERYMAARLGGRTEDVLRLVSDDVLLESSRDGTIQGRHQFRRYLEKVKPTGTWKQATWNSAIGKAEVLGNVRVLMVNVGVVAHMGFNRAGKINHIYVGTRRKTQK